MTTGEFQYFGLACPFSSSLPHIDAAVRYNNSFLQERERKKLILPPPENSVTPSSIAVRKLCSDSLVLLEDGQIYSFDSYASYEPWVAVAFQELNSLQLPFIDVAVGGAAVREGATKLSTAAQGGAGQFFLCLTSEGEVWVFGLNASGQLGLGHSRFISSPTKVEKFAPQARPQSNIAAASQSSVPAFIVAIAAGRSHSLFLTEDGSLYASGRNLEGQLGLAKNGRVQTIEKLLQEGNLSHEDRQQLEQELLEEESKLTRSLALQQLAQVVTPRFIHHFAGRSIKVISACNHLSACIDEQGRAYVWGYGLLQKQRNVPVQVEFDGPGGEGQQYPLQSISLGHGHALLLDEEGQAFSLGSNLTGALGLGDGVGKKRIQKAQQIALPCDNAVVSVHAGEFYSTLLDSQGRVYSFGSKQGGRLGIDESSSKVAEEEKSNSSDPSAIHTPQLIESVKDKIVSLLYPGSHRLVLFIPTRLTSVQPGVISLRGGTKLVLNGHGFFPRGDKANGQIQVSFTYLGHTILVPAEYDAILDSLHVTSPAFSSSGGASGGVYTAGRLEDVVIRASLDSGVHLSNALAVHAFNVPPASTASYAAGVAKNTESVTPAHGPVLGGATLTLKAPFDLVPYESPLVRFSVGDQILDVVPAKFDPVLRALIVQSPPFPSGLFAPSRPDLAEQRERQMKQSRFKHSGSSATNNGLPQTSSQLAKIEISLDGQTYFPFPKEFEYTSVSSTLSEPSSLPLAGGSLRLKVQGCYHTQDLRVKFTVGSYASETVNGTFLTLQQAREEAREQRGREARRVRKQRADHVESLRLQALAQAAWEEEHRDPKEKERLAREKEKLELAKEKEAQKQREKEAAQAKKDALLQAQHQKELEKASRAASRPGSGATSPISTNRPKSSLKSRAQSPGASGGKDHLGAPGSAGKERPTSAVSFAQDLVQSPKEREVDAAATVVAADTTREDGSTTPNPSASASTSTQSTFVPPEPDEFDALEERVREEEQQEDAQFALLNVRDRAAVGYILCTTKPFTRYGPCTPVIEVSLNGGKDFQPVQAKLEILPPAPKELEPSCGPLTGGTIVRVKGEHFYNAPSIQVQLRAPVVSASSSTSVATSRPPTAGADDQLANGPGSPVQKSRAPSASAIKKPGTATAGGRGGKDSSFTSPEPILPAAALPPPAPVTAPASFEVDSTGVALQFVSPAWTQPGATTAHVAFDPSQNAFSLVSATAQFCYYDTPLVSEAHPVQIAQAGGTEVTLVGRGFVASNCIQVRLTLHEEEEKKHGGSSSVAHKPISSPVATGADGGDATPHGTTSSSSARRKIAAASSHAATIEEQALLEAKRATQPRIILPATYHANDQPEDQLDEKKKKPTTHATTTGKKKEGELEPEPATITFLTPQAIQFNPDFADGSAMNRGLEVELALNGQQWVSTGILLRFEKDSKLKPAAVKKTTPAVEPNKKK